MPQFDSAGAGFARGFRGGAAIGLKKQQLDAAKEQLEADAQQQKRDDFKAAMKESLEASEDAFKQFTAVAVEMAPNVDEGDENFTKIRNGALASLMSHAMLLEQNRQQAAALEIPQELIDLMPDPQEFVRTRLSLFESQINSAKAAAANEDIDTSDFFAEIDGEVSRITKEDTPEGAVFKRGQEVIDAARIGKPINQTQEVVGQFRIPGLSEGDSSKEVMTLRQQAAAINTYTTIANDLVQEVNKHPEKLATVGDLIRAFGSLTAQVEGLSSVFGLDSPFVKEDENGNVTGEAATIADFNFRGLAGASQEVKRSLLDMVFLDLAAKGQTGRAVSDRDLEIFMDRTGIDSGDPEQVIAGLARGVKNNTIQITQNVRTRAAGAFTVDDLIPGGLAKFTPPESKGVDAKAITSALTKLRESGDFEKHKALSEAIIAGDDEKIKELMGNATAK